MESMKAFKEAFSYGDRNNLNFKFMAHLSDEEVADFIERSFDLMGDLLNGKHPEALRRHIIEGQKKVYSKPGKFSYETGHFHLLGKKVSEATIGLLTSSGHFLKGDDPKPFGIEGMDQEEAIARISDFLRETPQLSVIPKTADAEDLNVRHGGYDISGAELDGNITFPIYLMRDLEKEYQIGKLSDELYSFVGACAQGALKKVMKDEWIDQIKAQGIEGMVLVPV